jgi:hypothetical protein
MPTRVKGKHKEAKWMLWQESVHCPWFLLDSTKFLKNKKIIILKKQFVV